MNYENKYKDDLEIRKELMTHLQQEINSATLAKNRVMWEKMLAWLKKQKEQKPVEKQDYSGLSDFEARLMDCMCAAQQYRQGEINWNVVEMWAEELIELCPQQKPVEWNDTDMKEARENLITCCRDWEKGEPTTLLPIVAKMARHFLENTKPVEWDEYTETNLDRALMIIKKAKGNLQGYQSDDGIYECDMAIECIEHILYRGINIESVEDSVKFEEGFKTGRESGLRDGQKYVLDNAESYGLCKPMKWSEENEKTLEAIEMHIDNCGNTGMANALRKLHSCFYRKDCNGCPKHLEGYISGRGDAENMLLEMYGILSMPDGELRMKPRWKPSEEQMEALLNILHPDDPYYADLKSLHEQLQKM